MVFGIPQPKNIGKFRNAIPGVHTGNINFPTKEPRNDWTILCKILGLNRKDPFIGLIPILPEITDLYHYECGLPIMSATRTAPN